MRKIAVTGAGGFIGSHLVKYLKKLGYYAIGIDLKYPEWSESHADEYIIQDLRYSALDLSDVDEVYHLAADMGGMGYIESHKAEIVYNNTMINLNILNSCKVYKVKRLFFSSSACIYPGYLQNRADVKMLKEEDAYPADAEDGYGWEKLYMERNMRHFSDAYGLQIRIARFHNVYGAEGTYQGGREKAPAALCRKTILADNQIVIWGDGSQTRSFLYVDDCVEAIHLLMQSNYNKPLNIGSDRLISINDLADLIMRISDKKLSKKYNLTAPQGVKGRNADITKIKQLLNWEPKVSLEQGLTRTYLWIRDQLSQ